MENIWVVKLDNGALLDVRCEGNMDFKRGDRCVIRRDYFEDLGEICHQGDVPENSDINTMPQIVRRAGEPEVAEAEENAVKARALGGEQFLLLGDGEANAES